MPEATAPVLEVFASIQGEGAFVGRPQVFLRLRGCPLRCDWCDTPGSWRLAPDARARVAPPGGIRREPALAGAALAAAWVEEVDPGGDLAVSVTGGEPLIWPRFLEELRPRLGTRRLHLETAGGHPLALSRVLPLCDHLSLDLKLPADLHAPEELAGTEPEGFPRATDERAPADAADWTRVRRAILPLTEGRDACAKLVVAGGRCVADYAEILDDVRELAPRLSLILQPATPVGEVTAPGRELLLALVAHARGLDLDVRLIPQVHRLLHLP